MELLDQILFVIFLHLCLFAYVNISLFICDKIEKFIKVKLKNNKKFMEWLEGGK